MHPVGSSPRIERRTVDAGRNRVGVNVNDPTVLLVEGRSHFCDATVLSLNEVVKIDGLTIWSKRSQSLLHPLQVRSPHRIESSWINEVVSLKNPIALENSGSVPELSPLELACGV